MALDFEKIDKITGWLTKEEGQLLYDCAMKTPLNRVLELGTFLGKSTACLATAMKERKGVVITIDLFKKGTEHWDIEKRVFNEPILSFWGNMGRLGLSGNIIALKGNHFNILPIMSGKFGLVFIDGGHTAANIIQNALYAFDNTIDGGFIIFHDCGNKNWEDVEICVDVLSKKWELKPDIHKMIAIFKKE